MRALRNPAAAGLAAVALLALWLGAAQAQSSLGIGNAEVSATPSGPFAALFAGIMAVQRSFFTDLRHALVGIRDGETGFGWLVGLSFVYGVFHAAGPGHGKAVISSYMLANEVELKRGVALSFASAMAQGASAVLIVAVGWFVLRGSAVSMTDAAWGLELASYAGIALLGLWLLARRLKPLARRLPALALALRPRAATPTGLLFAGQGTFSDGRAAPALPRASGGYGAEICGDPAGDACDCGRPHILDPRALRGRPPGWRSGASAVLAIGLRPCSGAIVVLTFAILNGLYLAGGLSVLAMALGTAITVSALATLTVLARDTALRLGGARRGGAFQAGLEIAGALALTALGAGLFLASLPGL
ncbi:nickel/cobalt transporter [Aureimonas pseudogalii]|uniref:Nickel/cobalt efflux system n=1 Tax=Aureimonas pseudogalii TaxID=1744844 RepID=A0A7W6H5N4_9HYPH|nr:nickel/cobalt transporter [Aureimonas pseudogalii]MBB3999016.1 nickel/cobalt exporter [Aureimonas pseudogalii]